MLNFKHFKALLRSTTTACALSLAALPLATATGYLGAAHAQGVPTVDTQNIAQEIRQLQQMLTDELLQNQQLQQLLAQLETLREQYEQLQATYAALTSIMELPEVIRTQMEADLNGLLDQEFGDIRRTIQSIQNGDWSDLAGNASPQIRSQMEGILSGAGFDQTTLTQMANSGNAGAERTATRATTGALVSAAAQTSYDEAGQSLERVDRLVDLIDDMDDLKASVDLNTRVTAELAISLVAMWQLEAVQTVGAGQTGVLDAATIAEEDEFMDFTLPTLSAN